MPDSLQKKRRIFYFATIILLVGANVAASIQKQLEAAAAIARARAIASTGTWEGEAPHSFILAAGWWELASLAVAGLALLAWGIAICRRENSRWVWVAAFALLAFYMMQELMMV